CHAELADEVGSFFPVLWNHGLGILLVFVIVVVVAFRVFEMYIPVEEGPVLDVLFAGGFVLALLLILLQLARFLFLWSRLKRLLHAIARLPMKDAFGRLPDQLALGFGGYLFIGRVRFAHLSLLIRQLGLLAHALPTGPNQTRVAELREQLRNELNQNPRRT